MMKTLIFTLILLHLHTKIRFSLFFDRKTFYQTNVIIMMVGSNGSISLLKHNFIVYDYTIFNLLGTYYVSKMILFFSKKKN